MVIIESAGITDIGQKRKGNEDTFFVDDELSLYVVADGMGGHAAGEVASNLAAETFHNYMKNILSKETPRADAVDCSKMGQQLQDGLRLANQSVLQASQAKTSYAGMGTTVSAVYFYDNSFIVANVGDSPVFLIRNGKIELVSVLHTFASEMMAENPEMEEVDKSFYHILTQAVGVREGISPDVMARACIPEDTIVICSDGLSDMVSEEYIQDVTQKLPPAEACRQLVDLANKAGGTDNITIVVLKIKKVSPNGGFMERIKGLVQQLVK